MSMKCICSNIVYRQLKSNCQSLVRGTMVIGKRIINEQAQHKDSKICFMFGCPSKLSVVAWLGVVMNLDPNALLTILLSLIYVYLKFNYIR